jgi:hypothetical protein
MNREAFEKCVCDLNRAPTAWEGWQAASNKAIESLASWMLSRGFSTGHGDTIDDLLAELGGQIDDLQHDGQGPVAWLHIHPSGKGVSFSPPDKHGPIKGVPLYTHPQPCR